MKGATLSNATKLKYRNLSRNDLIRQLGYLEGIVAGLQAKLATYEAERPDDLEKWAESVEAGED